MNIHTQIKTLALLCALPLSSSFAAQPADPLQAKLAAIDAMSDHEVLSAVASHSQEIAERCLVNAKNELKQDPFLASKVSKKEAKAERLSHKDWATRKEFELCDDNNRKQYLQAHRDSFANQFDAAQQEAQEAGDSLAGNQLDSAYNYQVRRLNVYQHHATLLLAKNEKLQQKEIQWQHEKVQLQQDKAQLQQEKQSLLAQLQECKKLVNDQPIQDMPDAPPPYEESSSSSK